MCPIKKTNKIIAESEEIKFLSRGDLKEFPKEKEVSDDPLSMYTPEELRAMVLEQAQQEAEEIKQKASEEGYSQGKLLAEQEVEQFLEEVKKVFQESISQIVQLKTNFLEHLTPQVLKLVFQIAERVISAQVAINREVVNTIVKETIEELMDSQEIYLHINPDDYSLVESYIKSQVESGLITQRIVFVSDETVEKGGCIGETKTLLIDNQISSRLGLIVEKIINMARENGVDT